MADFPNCKAEHVHGAEGVDCKGIPKYQAASPDEKALVIAACNNEYYFYNNAPQKLTCGNVAIHGSVSRVNIRGVHHKFDVLEQFKFTSARARMAVILRDPRDGLIKLYCKGSDAKMRPLLTEKSFASGDGGQPSLWEKTVQHLDQMAKIGLRTLVCGYKVIPEKEFLLWYAKHKEASEAVKDRDALVSASMDRIETGLTLLGATAIEDKLQDGVPEAIAVLARANIKCWVLTGDKVETAINVSKAANLLTPAMEKNGYIKLQVSDELPDREARALTLELLEKAKKTVDATDSNPEEMAVIVSGGALNHVFPNRRKDPITGKVKPWSAEEKEAIDDIQQRFNQVVQNCKAVVCCRVSPNQKAEIVNLVVRFVPGAVTLAIGDGANDVSMIKAAHVGIGISGFEGLQAVMASDYSIGQFKYLEKLLLVHGQWSYRRISVLILYSFYKNALVAIVHVFFAFYSAFSAQIFYDAIIGSAFNIFFTSLPVMAAAVFNKETTAKSTLEYPILYRSGQNDECFNLTLLFKNIGLALFQSLAFYLVIVGAYSGTSLESSGYQIDHWVMSTAAYSGAVLVVNMNIALHTTTWNGWSAFFWVISIVSWFLFFSVYANIPSITPDIYGVPHRLFSTGHFWLVQILGTFVCIMPDVVVKFIKRQYYPTLRDIVAEKDRGYGPTDGSDMAKLDDIVPRSGTFKNAIELKENNAGNEASRSSVNKRVRTDSENGSESKTLMISTQHLNRPGVDEDTIPSPAADLGNTGKLSQPPSPSTSKRALQE